MPIRKKPWVFVLFFCVRVCCGDHWLEFAKAVPSMDASAGDLLLVLSLCVCLCLCVCPFVYVCKKKSMGVCVCLLSMCVVGTTFVRMLRWCHVLMALPET